MVRIPHWLRVRMAESINMGSNPTLTSRSCSVMVITADFESANLRSIRSRSFYYATTFFTSFSLSPWKISCITKMWSSEKKVKLLSYKSSSGSVDTPKHPPNKRVRDADNPTVPAKNFKPGTRQPGSNGGLGWASLQPTGVPEPNTDWEGLWGELFAKKNVNDLIDKLRTWDKEQSAEQRKLVQDDEDDGGYVLGGGFYGMAPEPEPRGVWAEALRQLRALRESLDTEQADDKRQLKRFTLSEEVRRDLEKSIKARRARLDLVHGTIERINEASSFA